LSALFLAIFFVGLMLYLSSYLEHVLKKKGIIIISKITGLILAALAAQLVFTGIKNFMRG
nr:MarC family protein [Spirochaetota bacterium]